MIPQERVNEAALESNDFVYNEDKTIGFTAGVRFAEEELKSVAMEFSEWCAKNKYKYTIHPTDINQFFWTDKYSTCRFTTSELFAKFKAERSKSE